MAKKAPSSPQEKESVLRFILSEEARTLTLRGGVDRETERITVAKDIERK